MSGDDFVPHHINATPDDLAGNNGIGRYIFLPGSDGRAKDIADHFDNVRVLGSKRGHNLYLGTLKTESGTMDVAAVASGMGTPSLDIIVQELFKLGARRFLRVGTAGSCQKQTIRVGDLVVAMGAVRDENTSQLYVPAEFPAIASPAFVQGAGWAAQSLGFFSRTHWGIIHCKDSLFAREFGEGPMADANREYMRIMEESGVVASEMESSHLFILASLFDHEVKQQGEGPQYRVLAGTVLGIIGDDRPFATKEETAKAVADAVLLGIETMKQVARLDGIG